MDLVGGAGLQLPQEAAIVDFTAICIENNYLPICSPKYDLEERIIAITQLHVKL